MWNHQDYQTRALLLAEIQTGLLQTNCLLLELEILLRQRYEAEQEAWLAQFSHVRQGKKTRKANRDAD